MENTTTVKTGMIYNEELGRDFEIRLEKFEDGQGYAWFGEQEDGSFVSCEVSADTKKEAIEAAKASWNGWNLRMNA